MRRRTGKRGERRDHGQGDGAANGEAVHDAAPQRVLGRGYKRWGSRRRLPYEFPSAGKGSKKESSARSHETCLGGFRLATTPFQRVSCAASSTGPSNNTVGTADRGRRTARRPPRSAVHRGDYD